MHFNANDDDNDDTEAETFLVPSRPALVATDHLGFLSIFSSSVVAAIRSFYDARVSLTPRPHRAPPHRPSNSTTAHPKPQPHRVSHITFSALGESKQYRLVEQLKLRLRRP